MGKDGKAADVISPSAAAAGSVGYVTATGTKSYASGDVNTFTNYYVQIVQPNGETYEYITDKDYTEMKNSIVEIAFSGGNARLSRANSSSDLSGTFNWNTKKLGSASVASNIDILDIGTTDKTYTSAYAKVFGQRIDGTKIESKNILYSHKNSSGAVDTLILKNVTNDSYSYGLITSAQSNGNSSKYDILSEGNRYSISIRGKFSVSYGDANMFNAGLSFKIGQGSGITTSKTAMAKKIESLEDSKNIRILCHLIL